MHIVVVSGNIFRREYASYVLSEAGYTIGEARTAEDLLAVLRGRLTAAIVLDLQLDGGDLAATLRAVRLVSAAPILWIGEPQRSRPLLMLDQRPGAIVSWPFRGDELLAAVAALLGRAGADATALAHRERHVGSAE